MANPQSSTRSDFYVYALFRDDGRVFYIGKGRGNRLEYHEREAVKGAKSHKCKLIRAIHARGAEIIKMKLHDGLTEDLAHRYEIALIKAIGRHPVGPLTNGTDGGEGLSGVVQTAEQIAKGAAKRRGQTRSVTARVNMSAGQRSSEARAKCNANTAQLNRGRKHSAEAIANMSAAQSGKKQSPLHIAKRAAAHIGKKRSAETCANISAALTGRSLTVEHRESVARAGRGRVNSPEAIAKTAAAHRGMKRSPETCAKISAGKIGKSVNLGRKWSAEHLAKRSATRRANNLAKAKTLGK